MTDPSTVTVTELRWNKDVFPPAGTDDNTSWIPCTTSDGQPAALAVDDQEREALGRRLLYLDGDDDVPTDAFFEPERLYRLGEALFRCEGVALYPGTTEPRAFGFQRQAYPRAHWGPVVHSERAWRRGWEDITCPEHGYECSPHAPAAECRVGR
ncbi:hypothetical protein [Streptomyces sp. NPDC052535]|uniref:hypothetical protein n=1 Tax=Streptomyces sp. NPDC052535 TaxID=3155531 RepID=UPI0034432FC5